VISVQRTTHRLPKLCSASPNFPMDHFDSSSCLFSVLMKMLAPSSALLLSLWTLSPAGPFLSHHPSLNLSPCIKLLRWLLPQSLHLSQDFLRCVEPPHQTPSKACHYWHLPYYYGLPLQTPFQSGISLPTCLCFHPLQ